MLNQQLNGLIERYLYIYINQKNNLLKKNDSEEIYIREKAPLEVLSLQNNIKRLEEQINQLNNENDFFKQLYNDDMNKDALQRALDENNELKLIIKQHEDDKMKNEKFYAQLREYVEYIHQKYNIPLEEFTNFTGSDNPKVNLIDPKIDLSVLCDNLQEENRRLQTYIEYYFFYILDVVDIQVMTIQIQINQIIEN